MTICTTCWAGFSALLTSSPRARSRTLAVKSLTTVEGDVGVEQGAADLADGAVDIRGGELALAAQVLEGLREAVGEVSEGGHGGTSLTDAATVLGPAVPTSENEGDSLAQAHPRRRNGRFRRYLLRFPKGAS